ncbi:diguanylate cyclase [Flavobacterium sp. W21_SRS_FM6]|uniref:diguanylate cyclase n=1 Tax=Flavobacterium sp. W21_SRS_FM6 TaxID=3240268 RepID=UPI003F934340
MDKTSVSYCIDPDWLPYEAIRNNQHVGMSADYMMYIGVLADINFMLVKTKTWSETLAKLQTGECQVASMLNASPEREKYLLFTRPFFVGANVLVSDSEQGFLQGYENIGEQMLGTVSNYRQAEYVKNYYPNIKLKLVETELAGLKSLASGEIDLFVGSLLSINAQIQKSGFSNLRIAGIAEPQDMLGMGVAGNDTELLARLNDAIAQLPEWVHVDIYKQWNNVRVIDEIDTRYIWGAAGIIFCLVIVGIWRQIIVRRYNNALLAKNTQLQALQNELVDKNQRLEFISIRDPLTAMFNRHFMQERLEQEKQASLRNNTAVCLILIDIDFFKAVNDQHGHSVGDTVLQQVAQIVHSTIREMDVAARWGGEEFVVLCPNSALDDAIQLATRLRDTISQFMFSKVGHITCSFGVAQNKETESFREWFDRADKALYQAKDGGRDAIFTAK